MQQRIDWSKPANGQRLLAAILAAQGMKMDYKSIAIMFGHGATYDAIEGHFRKIKRLAASLPDEHCDFTSPPSTPSTVRAQRKAKAGSTTFEDTTTPRQKTFTGRITKSKTKNSPGRTRNATVPAGGADREGGEIGLDEGGVSNSSAPPVAVQGVVENNFEALMGQGVVENNFEALMGGRHLGINGGGGDIFMGLPEESGSDDIGVARPSWG